MNQPSEFLRANPARAYGVEALAKLCGLTPVAVINQLASCPQVKEVVSGMWQWRAK